jgi:translation initiation factor IF-2
LNGVPQAGDPGSAVDDERKAREIGVRREEEQKQSKMTAARRFVTLEEFHQQLQAGRVKSLNLILKADVQGSVEALTQMVERSVSDKIVVRIIHSGVGGVTESDVMLAVASDAVVIGFHVKASPRAQELIEKEGIDARFYSIIYEVVEDIKKAMEGLLEPTYKEMVEGRAEIRQIFSSSKIGAIGGAMVIKGRVMRNHHVRVIRDHIVVFEGKLSSLKRFKDDVREVSEGYDCGLTFAGFNDFHEKDIVEAYKLEKVSPTLSKA